MRTRANNPSADASAGRIASYLQREHRSGCVDPAVVVFVLKADPRGVERLGAFLPDGSIVDLQTAHMSMRGRPAAVFRDRTAFRIANAEACALAREVLAWVDTQRPPGTSLKADLVRVVDEHPETGTPTGRRAPP